MQKDIASSVKRKIEHGAALIGIVDHQGDILRSEFLEVIQQQLPGYAFVKIDAWRTGIATSLVPLLLDELSTLSSFYRFWNLKKIGTSLTYTALSIAAKATGLEFGAVIGGLKYGDSLYRPSDVQNARKTLSKILERIEKPTLVSIDNINQRDLNSINELIFAACHINSISSKVRFLFFTNDVGSFTGAIPHTSSTEGTNRLTDHISLALDTILHIPVASNVRWSEIILGSLSLKKPLNETERLATENFISKSLQVSDFSANIAKSALIHLFSSREEWAQLKDFFQLVPFFLGLKYYNPILYSELVRNSQGDLTAQIDSTYMKVIESEVRVSGQAASNGSNINSIQQMIFILEMRGL